jgi:LmbE family N-acetylglucosaminyl deacetylase
VVTAAIAGRGTLEATWAPWLADQTWPSLDLVAVSGRRVVVLAAHPDDEILGVGALLATFSRRHHKIVMVWATDGEASHPGSTVMTPATLRRRRREESRRALARLGVVPVASHHLGLPDGGLAAGSDALRQQLAAIVCPGDLVLAPWSGDGHPDHEAIGAAASQPGTTTWHYPIWMWHWAEPADDRVPWQRLSVVPVADVGAKADAIGMFTSQTEPIGPAPEDAPVLPPHVVARFVRPCEWVFT